MITRLMGSHGAFGVTPHDIADIAFMLSSPCSVVQHLSIIYI